MSAKGERPPQEYYDGIKGKFAAERDLRLKYRPEGTAQYITDTEALAKYTVDPYLESVAETSPARSFPAWLSYRIDTLL
jgi:hypothetical protein